MYIDVLFFNISKSISV